MLRRVFQIIGAIALVGLLAIGGCQLNHLKASQPDTSTNWQQVEKQVEQTTASTEAVLAGSAFNRFFPGNEEGYERVYTQEKNGFAEAKLKQDGKELAMLSVSDIVSNPTAASKYLSSGRKLQGYPVVDIGNTGTSVLVAERIQVKVLSRDENFTQEDREAWIQKFDLEGLASLVTQ